MIKKPWSCFISFITKCSDSLLKIISVRSIENFKILKLLQKHLIKTKLDLISTKLINDYSPLFYKFPKFLSVRILILVILGEYKNSLIFIRELYKLFNIEQERGLGHIDPAAQNQVFFMRLAFTRDLNQLRVFPPLHKISK